MKPQSDPTDPFSRKTGPLQHTVDGLKKRYIQMWLEASSAFPAFTVRYGRGEQRLIQKETSAFVEDMLSYPEQDVTTAGRGNPVIRHAIDRAKNYIARLSRLTGSRMDEAYVDGGLRSARFFIDKIKSFDPSLVPEDIYQAMRNVWIGNSLQSYMDLEVGCSDALFAYSMFYPYTDNLMDDNRVTAEEKRRTSLKLKQMLEGNGHRPAQGWMKKLAGLLHLIENTYPRDTYPAVYQSLLAIFNAQLRSLAQQQAPALPAPEILDISFEKGGTSVLADGYLIRGELTAEREAFCFGYGAFLQLADDIQDVSVDHQAGHITPFSREAGRASLDGIANKLFHFILAVTDDHLRAPALKPLKDMIRRNTFLLAMEAIGRNKAYFNADYVRRIESHFPFRFKYLGKLRKKLEKRFRKYEKKAADLDTISAVLRTIHARLQ